ncbi:MAG: DNA translocase FtsK 4TM domain-containing protein [Polyangia bacterium]
MSKTRTDETTADNIEVPLELSADQAPSRRHEVLGVVVCLLALFLLLALVSYDGIDPDGAPIRGGNLVGPVGTWIAWGALALLGAATYLVDGFVWMLGVTLFTGKMGDARARNFLGPLVIGLMAAIAIHTAFRGEPLLGGHAAGGFLGALLGEILISMVSRAGTYLIAIGGMVLTILLVTDISLFLFFRLVGRLGVSAGRRAGGLAARVVRAWRESPESVVDDEGLAPPPVIDAAEEETTAPAGEPADAPKIVTPAPREKKRRRASLRRKTEQRRSPGEHELPSPKLLKAAEKSETRVDRGQLKQNADRLVAVLADFGITGEVREIHPGPVVTMYEFQPHSGIRLSRIERLSSEVAMALEVKQVRVVAPIPGKNAVGFELPNPAREIVRLRSMIEDESYTSSKAKLPLALGKDISGTPFAVDLAKMPHLLVAGTTGSGKSVAVNSMLLSLLFRYGPDELRLLLIDPKMIEFQPYNAIPHLLLPVVTDMTQATLALKWAVDEMERRYQLFADIGARHLESYNRKVEKILAGEAPSPTRKTAIDENGEEVDQETGESPKPPEKLPLIAICIDELADLMMVAAKDVETSIARLAQKARAAGIHLIVATQRPSTDVVTGLIKANFPARLSCQVSASVDSRTILGQNGAEKLLGNGDMLVLPPGTSDLVRVQGAFVADGEIRDVVDFLKSQAEPEYDEDILRPREGEEGSGETDDEEKDEVYDQAVQIVAESGSCSISMLQRKLRIGYNRSARIVELMEKEGVVGPPNHQNKREVLVSPHAP